MFVGRAFMLAGVSVASLLFGAVTAGQAAEDIRHLCSEKYQAAKAGGTLNGDTWPQFYSKCTAEAKESAAASEAAAAPPPVDVRHICSEKYQAAKAANALNGDTWPQFYSKCTAEVKANPPATAATSEAPAPSVAAAPPVEAAPPPIAENPPPVEAPPPAPVAAEAPPPAVAPPAPVAVPAPANPLKKAPAKKATPAPVVAAAPSTAVFPSAVSPNFAKETPYKARLKTCSEQYKANKATNANGGLKWIQKGGGYWSECNKHLKG